MRGALADKTEISGQDVDEVDPDNADPESKHADEIVKQQDCRKSACNTKCPSDPDWQKKSPQRLRATGMLSVLV